jgi:hypothetical protein
VVELVDNKPCKTVIDYQTDYATYGGCPLAPICFEPKMLKKELKRAWDVKEDDFLEWRRPAHLPLPK